MLVYSPRVAYFQVTAVFISYLTCDACDWLLLALDRLVSHFNETILGLAVGEIGNGSNGLFGVIVSESSGLLNAIALKDQLASLKRVSLSSDYNWPCAKLTLWTSPSWANLRPTRAPSSGICFQANSSGAVASPSSKSAPAGLPKSCPLRV